MVCVLTGRKCKFAIETTLEAVETAEKPAWFLAEVVKEVAEGGSPGGLSEIKKIVNIYIKNSHCHSLAVQHPILEEESDEKHSYLYTKRFVLKRAALHLGG